MRRILSVLVLLATLTPASMASARLSEEYGYDYEQVWRAAVRLVAVDFRFPVSERDPDIGYVLFEYQDRGRSHHGSIELIRVEGPGGGERVRVVIQIPGMPSYVERMMLDRFTRKLGEDYGPPRPVRRAPPEDDDEPDDEAPAVDDAAPSEPDA